jgi:hypothetical protein
MGFLPYVPGLSDLLAALSVLCAVILSSAGVVRAFTAFRRSVRKARIAMREEGWGGRDQDDGETVAELPQPDRHEIRADIGGSRRLGGGA